MAEPIVLSWSGGKDSMLALAALQANPRYEVVALLTSVTRGYDRVSIHGVRRALLEQQAAALGLTLHEVTLEPTSSNEAYEAAFGRAATELTATYPGLRRIAFGDLFLEDVRRYREQLLDRLGLAGLFPLWGRNTTALAREFIAAGYQARLVCVNTALLDGGFVGRTFDTQLLRELPATVDACGERGEFHTFVVDGPGFTEEIPYTLGEIVMRDERFAYCDLVPGSPATEDGATTEDASGDTPGGARVDVSHDVVGEAPA